jgi:MFS family permease
MPNLAASFSRTPDERAHFRAILLAFAALGFHVGVWAVLLADLARSLGLGPAALGFALTCQSAAGVAALLVGGRLADRFGRRPVLVVGVAGTGVYLALLAFVESYAALLAVFVFSGVVSMYDLACNSLGGDYERQHGKKAMTLFHAGFSGSAALGALGSGAALASGVAFGTIFVLTGAALLVLSVAALRAPLPRRVVEPDGGGGEPSRSMFALLRVPAVFACVAVIFMCFSTDAALEGYTSIYLRDFLGAEALLGGVGLASLYFAGAMSRLFSAAAILRFGERNVLFSSGLVAALGLGAVISTGMPSVAAVGLLLVGVALAPVAPIAFSMTARATPGQSGQAISLVTTSGYFAFTLSPIVVGGVADLSSLRISFVLLLALCLGISILSRRTPK